MVAGRRASYSLERDRGWQALNRYVIPCLRLKGAYRSIFDLSPGLPSLDSDSETNSEDEGLLTYTQVLKFVPLVSSPSEQAPGSTYPGDHEKVCARTSPETRPPPGLTLEPPRQRAQPRERNTHLFSRRHACRSPPDSAGPQL